MNKGKQIYFKNELAELRWVVPMFKDTHRETWSGCEAEVVESILKKIMY